MEDLISQDNLNISVNVSEEKSQEVANLIKDILNKMSVEAHVSIEQNIKGSVFNISSPDSSLLIGQRGINLHALQVLAQGISYRKLGVTARFSVDVDDYKKKREWYLRENAKKALQHVKETGRSVELEPMSAHERRIIHAFLSEEYGVETESIGEEPNRRIVIKPKAKGEI